MSIIKLENISKTYGIRTVLKDYSIEIEDKEFICITGESGKGKTTLLNIMGMLDYPDSGNVYIFNQKNPKLDSKKGREILRHNLTYVFQNYGLVDDRTVRYNLEINLEYLKNKKTVDLKKALEEVGLDESYLKMKVYELSGGEQQRVALAKLFLRDYSLVLADEPTGSLDSINRDKIMNIFCKLHDSGKTIIIVTHDKEVAKCAGRIIEL